MQNAQFGTALTLALTRANGAPERAVRCYLRASVDYLA